MSAPVLVGAGVERGGRWILRDASLGPEPGEVLALVGPNGAGKTTALRLLAGLVVPDEGRALLGERDLVQIPRREVARAIAYVPVRAGPGSSATVAELVATGRHPHKGPLERITADDEARIAAALVRVRVRELADRRASTLSGGELARVLLARGLATGARTLLLDEPTANLDLAHALDVLATCRELAGEGIAIALAIHDLAAAFRTADRAAVFDGGHVVACGTVDEVLTDERLRAVFGVASARWTDPGGQEHRSFVRA